MPAGTPVVLISIDTLRADRLPVYGYQRVGTPAIDSLRRDGILYTRAYSHVPFTLPSHTSILTGLLPSDHGLRDNIGYKLDIETVPFLPSVFRNLGYATGAAVSAYVLNRNTGLGSGWDLYEDQVQVLAGRDLGGLQRKGPETLARAVEWLDSIGDRPFFLFFHIYEPHTPYEAPEPFASRYSNPYDAEVAAADAVVGDLIQELKTRELYDRALVILLSDHGEGLMDHGDPEHNLFVYREVLEVPLLLKLPSSSRADSTVETPAQLIDVFPTLLHLLALERPTELEGTSLLHLDEPRTTSRQVYGENFYPRLHFGWSELASLIEWPYHLIYGPDPELYNLEEDPGETRSILDENRHIYGRLKQVIETYDRTVERPDQADPEAQERLAALGYIGGGSFGESSGPLPDPKSKLGAFTNLRGAFASFATNDFEQAVEQFEALLDQEPYMVAAWRYLGRSLRRLGRQDEALAAFQEALKLSNGAPEIARGAAELLLDMNRLDQAKEHALLALPVFDIAYEILAEIALRQDNLEEAKVYSQQAMARRGSHLSPLITRGRVLMETGEPEEALALTQKAEEEFGDRNDFETLRSLYLTRGRAYAELGEADQATQAFRREIELNPDALAPYTHLAMLYALLDDGPRAGRTLREMVETNTSPEAYAEAVRTLRLMGDEQSANLVLRDAQRRWPESKELRGLAG